LQRKRSKNGTGMCHRAWKRKPGWRKIAGQGDSSEVKHYFGFFYTLLHEDWLAIVHGAGKFKISVSISAQTVLLSTKCISHPDQLFFKWWMT
jgi:hypothetical protein